MLNITSFTPTSGPVGTNVVISVSGLSSEATADDVYAWIGAGTPITELSNVVITPPQSISIRIPSVAESGVLKLACNVDGTSAISSEPFIVTKEPNPEGSTFTGLHPRQGGPGTKVTIQGSNLNLITKLEFGNREIPDPIKSSSEIMFKVPRSLKAGVYHLVGYTSDDERIACPFIFDLSDD